MESTEICKCWQDRLLCSWVAELLQGSFFEPIPSLHQCAFLLILRVATGVSDGAHRDSQWLARQVVPYLGSWVAEALQGKSFEAIRHCISADSFWSFVAAKLRSQDSRIGAAARYRDPPGPVILALPDCCRRRYTAIALSGGARGAVVRGQMHRLLTGAVGLLRRGH
jgi:hypothetical protein